MNLTPSQRAVLTAATDTQGRVETFPDHLKGGARAKVIQALLKAGCLRTQKDGYCLTDAGYAAIGCTLPSAAIKETPVGCSIRQNTKQAQVIALLQRPEGATIAQLCQATGWQAHTVRGTLSGAFKKRLGLTIASEKAHHQPRVYRIV